MFLINVPVGAALLFLIGFLVKTPGDAPKNTGGRMDWTGLALIAACLGCLQVVLDRGQEDDWFASSLMTTFTLVSASAFILLIWWEAPHENPLVDLKLFKRRDFSMGFVLMLFFGFMILGSTYLLPAYAQNVMGYRATEAGEIIAPGGILLMLLFPVIGRVVSKIDLRIMIGFGICTAGFALWWMTNFYLQASFWVLALGRIMQAMGLACLFLPINSLAFRDVPKDRTNYASALINLARNFGGSVGISVASTLVTRREQFHQARIVEHLQPLDPAFSHFTTQLSHAAATTQGTEPLARVFQLAREQIMVLSYIDAFKFFAVAFLALLPLLLFVKPGSTTRGGEGTA